MLLAAEMKRAFAARGVRLRSADTIRALEAGREALAGIDILVVNGEGTMHHGAPLAYRLADLAGLARGAGVPSALVNSVYGANPPDLVERLKGFDRLYVRDDAAAAEARRDGLEAKVAPDLSLAWQPDPSLLWRPGGRIVVTDSTVAETSRALFRQARALRADFLPIKTRPPPVDFLPDGNTARQRLFDRKRLVANAAAFTHWGSRYARASADLDGFARRLADGVAIVVAGRFHAACAALVLGVPFVALSSNTGKVAGLLDAAGMADRLVGASDLTRERLAAFALWRPGEDERRRAFLAAARGRAATMVRDVAGLAVVYPHPFDGSLTLGSR